MQCAKQGMLIHLLIGVHHNGQYSKWGDRVTLVKAFWQTMAHMVTARAGREHAFMFWQAFAPCSRAGSLKTQRYEKTFPKMAIMIWHTCSFWNGLVRQNTPRTCLELMSRSPWEAHSLSSYPGLGTKIPLRKCSVQPKRSSWPSGQGMLGPRWGFHREKIPWTPEFLDGHTWRWHIISARHSLTLSISAFIGLYFPKVLLAGIKHDYAASTILSHD